jgi:MYXO-CTERM domain-containing protein
MTGQAAVCTDTCTTTSCPTGYSCTIAGHNAEDQPAGYCFASGPILPPVLPPVDGGAGDDDTPGSSGSTGGGCSVAHDDSSPSPGILGLAFGLAFAASRRRRRA